MLKSRIIDFILFSLLLLLLFVPSIRLPVVSNVQKALLYTGLFNASSELNQESETFDYKFVLYNMTGEQVNLNRKREKVLFINIWATWCPPCIAEMPEIAKLYKSVGGEVEFLMISVDQDQLKAKKWVKDKRFTVQVYFPKQINPSLSYEAIPTTWVIDRNGKIIFKKTGMAQYNTEKFKSLLLSL
ncbi:MAG: TlpA disulfide reductase family protein [Tunicatimonas sp.]|uniref:TlpA family protein disulfide reductase n=1 Tax=Tunicatimonas sp. TaxID=1940096 RepID=UPI003C76448D